MYHTSRSMSNGVYDKRAYLRHLLVQLQQHGKNDPLTHCSSFHGVYQHEHRHHLDCAWVTSARRQHRSSMTLDESTTQHLQRCTAVHCMYACARPRARGEIIPSAFDSRRSCGDFRTVLPFSGQLDSNSK